MAVVYNIVLPTFLPISGRWARATPLKNMNVNWDDEIPNINGKIKNGNQTTNQFLSSTNDTWFFMIGVKPQQKSTGGER